MRTLSVVSLIVVLVGHGLNARSAAACDGPGKYAGIGMPPAAVQDLYAQQQLLKQQRAMQKFALRQAKQQQLIAQNLAKRDNATFAANAKTPNRFGGVSSQGVPSLIDTGYDNSKPMSARVLVFSP